MNLETFELPWLARGWRPPSIGGRVQADPTAGGNVVHVAPGSVGDQVWRLPFGRLSLTPRVTIVRTYAPTAAVADTVTANQALGYQIDMAAGTFGAVSVATMTLKRAAGATGSLSVEIWGKTAGDAPDVKIGLLGLIDVVNDLTVAFQEITVWSDRHAWPVLPPYGGYLVLNANDLAGGAVSWAGEGVTLNAHAKWNAAAWTLANGELSATVWQGGDFLTLRGFQEAHCYPDGAGPQLWTLTLDDGTQFEGYLVDVSGGQLLAPLAVGSTGSAVNVVAAFQPVSETGQIALG